MGSGCTGTGAGRRSTSRVFFGVWLSRKCTDFPEKDLKALEVDVNVE